MQGSQQINKTKIDPGDKHFSLGHTLAMWSQLSNPSDPGEEGREASCSHLRVQREGRHWSPNILLSSFPSPGAQNNALEWCGSFSKIRVSSRGSFPSLWLQFQHPHVPSTSAKHFQQPHLPASPCPYLYPFHPKPQLPHPFTLVLPN